LFWRRRNEPEPEPAADLEPAVEGPAAEPIPEPVSEPPAEDIVTPADEAAADADIRPEVVEPVDPPAASDGQLAASPFGGAPGSGGWSAEAMKTAPATLDAGLERTRSGFVARLREALGEESGVPVWEEVEETLIAGDVGASLALEIVERARTRRHPDGAEAAVREVLADLLVERDINWHPQPAVGGGPAVLLVVGVNGTGKTTTIGKLAARYAGDGHSLILAAADTFRAAAIDQLRIWAERAGVPVVAHAPNADPGAVVYDALDAAVARRADLVIADTAGRLHTKSNLMDELAKIRRIIDKRLPGAVPETLFVLDATTGQNGLAQARAFHEAVGLTGIVLTKLDSTAKGGIVFAIEHTLGVPVRYVGVGEKIGDLLPFDPDAFVNALFGEAATD
jgi:fused signal recognition particle receptor